MLTDEKLERLEKEGLDFIRRSLLLDLNRLIDGLNSRLKIFNDWYDRYIRRARAGYNTSDLDKGAERVFHTTIRDIPVHHWLD